MMKIDNTSDKSSEINIFKKFFKKVQDICEHFLFIVPLFGGVYQSAFLISIGCLRYFSWSQAISDSIVVCCYLFMVSLGIFVRRRALSELRFLLYPIDILLVLSLILLYIIFFYFGSEWLLCLVMVVTGLLIGPVTFKDLNEFLFSKAKKSPRVKINITFVLILLLTHLGLIVGASFRYDSFTLEDPITGQSKYKVEYRNDTYMFGRGVLESGENENAITIFRVDQAGDKITTDKPSIKLSSTIDLLMSLHYSYWWLIGIILPIIFTTVNLPKKKN